MLNDIHQPLHQRSSCFLGNVRYLNSFSHGVTVPPRHIPVHPLPRLFEKLRAPYVSNRSVSTYVPKECVMIWFLYSFSGYSSINSLYLAAIIESLMLLRAGG